jgi:hypothetical protein
MHGGIGAYQGSRDLGVRRSDSTLGLKELKDSRGFELGVWGEKSLDQS